MTQAFFFVFYYFRLKYTKTAKLNLLELLDVAVRIKGSYRKNLQRRYFNEHAHATDHPTIRKLLAILRISLLIIDSDIHLGDLLRFVYLHVCLIIALKCLSSN